MLFSTFVLVPVNREHDGLQQRIDLRHCDKPAEMCDMSRLGLKEEKQIAVFLSLLVVREKALLKIGGVLEMIRNFVLLAVC